jgi:hypothetical protein
VAPRRHDQCADEREGDPDLDCADDGGLALDEQHGRRQREVRRLSQAAQSTSRLEEA